MLFKHARETLEVFCSATYVSLLPAEAMLCTRLHTLRVGGGLFANVWTGSFTGLKRLEFDGTNSGEAVRLTLENCAESLEELVVSHSTQLGGNDWHVALPMLRKLWSDDVYGVALFVRESGVVNGLLTQVWLLSC